MGRRNRYTIQPHALPHDPLTRSQKVDDLLGILTG
jgi:hypothetical protein